jgi:hypothetical protein
MRRPARDDRKRAQEAARAFKATQAVIKAQPGWLAMASSEMDASSHC